MEAGGRDKGEEEREDEEEREGGEREEEGHSEVKSRDPHQTWWGKTGRRGLRYGIAQRHT